MIRSLGAGEWVVAHQTTAVFLSGSENACGRGLLPTLPATDSDCMMVRAQVPASPPAFSHLVIGADIVDQPASDRSVCGIGRPYFDPVQPVESSAGSHRVRTRQSAPEMRWGSRPKSNLSSRRFSAHRRHNQFSSTACSAILISFTVAAVQSRSSRSGVITFGCFMPAAAVKLGARADRSRSGAGCAGGVRAHQYSAAAQAHAGSRQSQ